jgi:hypothetical protein
MAEIFGTAFTETAKDHIVTLITALMSTMSAGYDPTFSYIYEKHGVAKLELNGVTIDMVGIDPANEVANDYNIRYLMEFSVRVHTAYSDGVIDGQKNMRLLSSIQNKLKNNIKINDYYRIEYVGNMNVNESFAESATLGGELSVVISYVNEHTQE